jgi:hypothetical protein
VVASPFDRRAVRCVLRSRFGHGGTGGVVTFTYGGGALAVNGTIVAKFRVTVN